MLNLRTHIAVATVQWDMEIKNVGYKNVLTLKWAVAARASVNDDGIEAAARARLVSLFL
jgi:hypothetical protein